MDTVEDAAVEPTNNAVTDTERADLVARLEWACSTEMVAPVGGQRDWFLGRAEDAVDEA